MEYNYKISKAAHAKDRPVSFKAQHSGMPMSLDDMFSLSLKM